MSPIKAIKLAAAVSALALTATQVNAQASGAPVVIRNGEIGFAISQMIPAMAKTPIASACPQGFSTGTNEVYKKSLTPEAAAAHDLQLKKSLDAAGRGDLAYYTASTHVEWKNPDGSFICLKPQAAKKDPDYRTAVNSPDERVEGVRLDGQASRSGRRAAGGCASQDFVGADGKSRVNNQFYRVFACTKAFQGDSIGFTGFQADMLQGTWTLVFKLSGVDNLQNDKSVDVGIYSSVDPLALDGAGKALPNVTYTATDNPRYRATTKGRIVGGFLTTDPVDVRFMVKFNGEPPLLEHYVHGARFRLTIAPDGTASGYLAGYNDIDSYYHNSIAFADNARDSSLVSENNGWTCSGVYQALHRFADGNRDPVTGKCTSISAALKVKAVPAFVLVPKASAAEASGSGAVKGHGAMSRKLQGVRPLALNR